MIPLVVFDCMVFVQAAGNPLGPSGRCLNLAESGAVQLLLSNDVLTEISDVMNRSSVQRNFRTLTPQRVAHALTRIQQLAIMTANVTSVFSLARDPKDSMYLNLAIAAGAECIVSRDRDMLDLMTANDADSVLFRTRYPTIRILDPAAFLQTLSPATLTNPPSTTP